jgi:hypothetical protein
MRRLPLPPDVTEVPVVGRHLSRARAAPRAAYLVVRDASLQNVNAGKMPETG